LGSYFFLIFFLIVILFTWWGWSRVLAPYVLPAVWSIWRVIQATMITMIIIAPLSSGWWFRTYGYDLTDLIVMPMLSKTEQQQFKWRRENNTTYSGDYVQNWREKSGQKQLPPDWKGESQHRLHPAWSILIPVGAIGAYIILESQYKRRNSVTTGKKRRRRQRNGVPTDEEQCDQLNRILARSASRRGKPFLAGMSVPQASPPASTTDDRAFFSALRNLGYKSADIRDAAQRCTEQDLEARVRHALQILARK